MFASLITTPIKTSVVEITNGLVISIDRNRLIGSEEKSYIDYITNQLKLIIEDEIAHPDVFQASPITIRNAITNPESRHRIYQNHEYGRYHHMIIRKFDNTIYPEVDIIHPVGCKLNIYHSYLRYDAYECIFLGEDTDHSFSNILRQFCWDNGYHACMTNMHDEHRYGVINRYMIVKFENAGVPDTDILPENEAPIRHYPNYLRTSNTFSITKGSRSLFIGSIPVLSRISEKDLSDFSQEFISSRVYCEKQELYKEIPKTHSPGYSVDVFFCGAGKPYFLDKYLSTDGLEKDERTDTFFVNGTDIDDVNGKIDIIRHGFSRSSNVARFKESTMTLLSRENHDDKLICRLTYTYNGR